MVQEPLMAATGLKASHLGRSHIEGPWATPEGAGASPRLMVRLQQGDG